MLHHRTTDIAQRAFTIAFRAAEEVWKQTGNFDTYHETYEREYQEALTMLAGGSVVVG